MDNKDLKPNILFISSCTKTKKLPPNNNKASSLSKKQPKDLAKEWMRKLDKDKNTLPAEQLYGGGFFWAKRIGDSLGQEWSIVSAGCGLIKNTEPIPYYQLTISKASKDSVLYNRESLNLQKWWGAINQVRNNEEFPITKLSETSKPDLILINVTAEYLNMIEEDLFQLLTKKSLSRKLRLIGMNKKKVNPLLSNYVLPYETSFDGYSGKNKIGGPKQNLHKRMAYHFISYVLKNKREKVLLDLDTHKTYVHESQKGLKPPVYPKRNRISEKELDHIINQYLDEGTFSSPTPLLKHLRNKGIAVEQKRLSKAFWEQKGR